MIYHNILKIRGVFAAKSEARNSRGANKAIKKIMACIWWKYCCHLSFRFKRKTDDASLSFTNPYWFPYAGYFETKKPEIKQEVL